MADYPKSPNLKPLPKAMLRVFRFDRRMAGDTIQLYLENNCSVAVCCRDCGRLVELTPPDMAERFPDRLGLTMADLMAKLTCNKDHGGCGSRDIAIWPHPYAHKWTWEPVGD